MRVLLVYYARVVQGEPHIVDYQCSPFPLHVQSVLESLPVQVRPPAKKVLERAQAGVFVAGAEDRPNDYCRPADAGGALREGLPLIAVTRILTFSLYP
jgi:hypothetical protein